MTFSGRPIRYIRPVPSRGRGLTQWPGAVGEGVKHPDKDIRRLLATAEAAGWVISKGNGYFKALCPCGNHKKWVHLTPSGGSYLLNLRKWFERQPCWKGADG